MNLDNQTNDYIASVDAQEAAVDVLMSENDIEYDEALKRYQAGLERVGLYPNEWEEADCGDNDR